MPVPVPVSPKTLSQFTAGPAIPGTEVFPSVAVPAPLATGAAVRTFSGGASRRASGVRG